MTRRMGRVLRAAGLGAAALALAGCETVSDYTPEFSVLGPSEASEPAPEPAAEGDLVRRPAEAVLSLELGQMDRGKLLIAHGLAPAADWFKPRLEPRRGGRPGPDGFLDFDLTAAPPELNGGEAGARAASPAQRRLTAVLPISRAALAQARGLRVHAGAGVQALRFAPPAAEDEDEG